MAGHGGVLLTMHLGFCAVAMGLVVVAWRRLPVAYAAWATMTAIVSLSAWANFGRYFATLFPLFIVAAMLLKGREVYHAVAWGATLLLALFTLMFTHGIWVS